jgi:hypothetical protein
MGQKYVHRIVIGAERTHMGERISDADRRIKIAKAILSDRFGGYTAYPHQGGWYDDDGTLVEEIGWTFHVITGLSLEEHMRVVDTADDIGRVYDQDTVVVHWPDNMADFVKVHYLGEA